MKTVLLAAIASLFLAFAAHAASLPVQVDTDGATCTKSGVASRVAFGLPDGPECCSQQLRCTQFLSTTTIELARTQHRT